MRALIDTHVILWWLFDDEKLSAKARALITNLDHKILVSPISGYEIQLKCKLEKLVLPQEFSLAREMQAEVWSELPVSLLASEVAGKLRIEHRDPFDRLIAAQAITENIPLISADEKLDSFPVKRVW